MIHMGWAVYRWPVRIMQEQPERVKDELRIFLGSQPQFRAIADYLPTQRGRTFQLKEHQKEALDALAKMREAKETIALIHHATGTGKTVTAVSDAKRLGGRTLYIAHTKDLITQAADTFRELWPEASLGLYVENHKETDAQVICASVQSVALNLDSFLPDAFDYLIIDEAHHAAAETYQKVLAYFTPRFTLGLTATPERADDQDILEIFKNTAHGLIVDYIGIFDDVAKALAFDPDVVETVITNIESVKQQVPELVAACVAFFPGVDRTKDDWEALLAAQDCLPTDDDKDKFGAQYRVLNRVWNALSPDNCLVPYKAEYKWLSKVYDSIRPTDERGKLIWAALGPKTLELVHENISVEEVKKDEEIFHCEEWPE